MLSNSPSEPLTCSENTEVQIYYSPLLRPFSFSPSTALLPCCGFQIHDIAVLVNSNLLKPLENPAANAPKHFALVDILALASDIQWLYKATRTVSRHWQAKNNAQRNKQAGEPVVLGPTIEQADE